MGDLNLLGLLEQDNFLLNFDKDDNISKRIEKPEEDFNDWFNADTLNQVLPILDSFFNGSNGTLQIARVNECSSDSGLSSEESFSPKRNKDIDDFPSADSEFLENFQSIRSTPKQTSSIQEQHSSVNESSFDDAFEFVKEEVVEYEEMPVSSVSIDSASSDSLDEVYILPSDSSEVSIETDCIIESPIIISYPESRTMKLVNRGKRFRNMTNNSLKNIQLKRKSSDGNSSDKDGSDDSDFLYPRLQLTPEEMKLAAKEGIKLPTHYPLSKMEERELKRIRRKIRNKISAQDSRRRKKEYVDSLEEKMKRTSEENAHLMKRIKTLENQRLTLAAQVRKLQATLARCSGQTAQPSTCLLVLIMSLALVLAPTLKNSTLAGENNEDEGISLPEDVSTSTLNSVRSSSRNLLFSHKAHEGQCNVEEETKTISEQLLKMQIPNANVLTGLLEMLKMKLGKESTLPKEHDYFRPRKRPNSADKAIVDSWSPFKMAKVGEQLVNTVIVKSNNKTNNVKYQEPVIVDLLSD